MRVTHEEITRLITEVERRGFTLILSRPDRHYHLRVWGPTGDVFLAGTLVQVAAVLRGVIMAYDLGKRGGST